MNINSAVFITSSTDYKNCPPINYPEYAFIGRSNVGKSSLINMLVNVKNLAKTSNKPGKTKLINHFLINGNWYLVDLPGYGYAKDSIKKREAWLESAEKYLLKRDNLMLLFLLIDLRIPPQKIDLSFLRWLGKNKIPFSIVFTKSDKLSKRLILEKVETYKTTLLQEWEFLPEVFMTSSRTLTGRDEMLNLIGKLNKKFNI